MSRKDIWKDGIGTQFQPGQSGKPKGAVHFKSKIDDYLKKTIKSKDGKTAEAMDRVVQALMVQAMNGNMKAIQYLIDRVDGPITQKVAHSVDNIMQVDDEKIKSMAKAILDDE